MTPPEMKSVIEARIMAIKEAMLSSAYEIAMAKPSSLDKHRRLVQELDALEHALKVQPYDHTGWLRAMGD